MKFSEFLEDYGGWLAFVVAAVATAGSLYFSEVAGFIPCRLCWFQRIFMYPLAIITLVGSLRRDEYLPSYVLPFSIIGMGISTYHVLLEKGVFPPSPTCALDVPCNVSYVNYFGFLTIAGLALIAFTLITAIMVGVWLAQRRSRADELDVPAIQGGVH